MASYPSSVGKNWGIRLSLVAVAVVGVLTGVWLLNSEEDVVLSGNPSAVSGVESTKSTPLQQRPHAKGSVPALSAKNSKGRALTQSAGGLTPLPPLGTPVKDVIVQLTADAEAGAPAAACRIGAELARCWQTRDLLRVRDQQLSRLAGLPANSGEAQRINAMAAGISARTKDDKAICDGVSDDQMDGGWRYLLSAALSGNAAAVEQFVVNPPLSHGDVLTSLEGWTAYRDFAPTLLQRAIESGSVRALYLGFFSAGTGLGPGGQSIVPRDPYQAIVYGQAALPLVDPNSAQMIRNAMPGLQAEAGGRAPTATQEGEALRRRFFASGNTKNVSSDVGRANPAQCNQ